MNLNILVQYNHCARNCIQMAAEASAGTELPESESFSSFQTRIRRAISAQTGPLDLKRPGGYED